MSPADPKSLIDKLVGVSVSVLVASAAIYFAVHLLAAVWVGVVIVAVVVVGAAALVGWWRRQRGGW